MEQVTLSVRLMVYNNEAFIKEAIDGILFQKVDFNYEIVVGDDFSTDNTLNIIKEYAKIHPDKFRILDRPINGKYFNDRKRLGRIHNFVDIVNHCKGKYIAILDGDDYWTDPNKLQKQVDFLEANTNFSICYHQVSELFENGEKKITNESEPEEYDANYLLSKGWHLRSVSVVFRKKELPSFPKWVYEIEAMDYTTQCLLTLNGQKIKCVKLDMAIYRIHSNNVSSKLNRNYIRVLRRNRFHLILLKSIMNNYDYQAIINSRINEIDTKLFYQLRAKDKKTPRDYLQIVSLAISLGKLNPFNIYQNRLKK